MDLTTAGLVGAVATLLGTISAFIVTVRRSANEDDDHWQAMVRAQLAAQIERNAALDQRVSDLWEALDVERQERRRIEAVMAARIALLEETLRKHGIPLP